MPVVPSLPSLPRSPVIANPSPAPRWAPSLESGPPGSRIEVITIYGHRGLLDQIRLDGPTVVSKACSSNSSRRAT